MEDDNMNNNNVKENRNVYIMNLEGGYLANSNFTINTKNINKTKLYSATIPFSLETLRAEENTNKEFYKINNKIHTELFVNVTFKKDYFIVEDDKKKVILNKKEIRKKIYKDGVTIDNVDYVFYKRGSNKVKEGSVILIKKEYCKDFIKRTRLGVEFKENEVMKDLASIYAYDALIMSGIEFTIDIKSDEILIIDDIYAPEFNYHCSVTELNKDGEIITENKDIKLQPCLSDGQSLMDESVFKDIEYKNIDFSKKGFVLLRNDYMKSCSFNTKLRYYLKEVKKIDKIVEKLDGKETGRIIDVNKLKLVITPNSLKFLKLKNKFDEDIIKCYLHWLNNIDSTFGVVKYSKSSNFDNANRMTYQLLNSLPLTYSDVEDIVNDELDYVDKLKNDFLTFRNYIGNMPGTGYKTKDIIDNLISVNADFIYTDKYKEWKKEQVRYYIERLKKAKIRIKDSLYVTMVSNPFEMLQAVTGDYDGNNLIAKGDEVYCPYYKEEEEFCVSRNPHINAGNVCYARNVYREEYKYFNLDDYCIIVNFQSGLAERLQGADTDSDTVILLPSLSKFAKECLKYKTPLNGIKGKVKERHYNMLELAELDHQLSDNKIGSIVNKSQIVNSYMNEAIYYNKDKELINKYYNISSKLSSLSQIEIDKAKKSFDNIKIIKELNKINKEEYNNELIFEFKYYQDDLEIDLDEFKAIRKQNREIKNDIRDIKKDIEKAKDKDEEIKRLKEEIETKLSNVSNLKKCLVVPNFFNNIIEENNKKYKEFKEFKTPLDYLQDILKKKIKKTRRTKKVDIKDLLIQQKELNIKPNTKQIKEIYAIIEKANRQLKGIELNKEFSKDNKEALKIWVKREIIKQLQDKKINKATVLRILRIAFNVAKDKQCNFNNFTMLTLNILYRVVPEMAIGCFKYNPNLEVLQKCKNGNIEIWGKKYKRIELGLERVV